MKSHQIATVESIHPNVEEKITLRVGDTSVVCFYFGGDVELGRSYEVEFHPFEWQRFRPAHELALPTLTRLNNAFRYDVVGRLFGSIVDAGILLVDQAFATEGAWLDGKMVHFEVDRIDVEIIGAIP